MFVQRDPAQSASVDDLRSYMNNLKWINLSLFWKFEIITQKENNLFRYLDQNINAGIVGGLIFCLLNLENKKSSFL